MNTDTIFTKSPNRILDATGRPVSIGGVVVVQRANGPVVSYLKVIETGMYVLKFTTASGNHFHLDGKWSVPNENMYLLADTYDEFHNKRVQ